MKIEMTASEVQALVECLGRYINSKSQDPYSVEVRGIRLKDLQKRLKALTKPSPEDR